MKIVTMIRLIMIIITLKFRIWIKIIISIFLDNLVLPMDKNL